MKTLFKKSVRQRDKSAARSYNPWNRNLRNDFLDFWDGGVVAETIPSINIGEEQDKYTVEMAAPGLKKEDFDIEIEGNVMTISVETESEEEKGKEAGRAGNGYSRKEFNYSEFSRSLALPEYADTDYVTAKYTDGILSLSIPKRQEVRKNENHKISVE